MHESILIHRDFLYLKVAAALSSVAIVAYLAYRPLTPRGGDTWLGYALGTLGAAMIVWLTWFGVRKRRYARGRMPLSDWLSAHVYLGLSLIVIATLHTGFQFGWNVHTGAYALMLAVIGSGAIGVIFYQRYPQLLSDIQRGEEFGLLLQSIADIDGESRELVSELSDTIAQTLLAGIEQTRIGGSLLRQLAGPRPGDAPTRTLEAMRELISRSAAEHALRGEQLVTLLRRKCEFVERAQQIVRIRALLRIWLYAHVPLSLALFVALFGHVLSVFFYR